MFKEMLKINKGKIFIVASLICLVSISFFTSETSGKLKSYYSGDAIEFNGDVYVGTTNTGKFEVFVLDNNELSLKSSVVSPDYKNDTFYDAKFKKEGAKLYVYLSNGKYMYKYNVSNPMVPVLEKTIKDNSWYWFSSIDVFNGNLVTVGDKGVRIWNDNLQVINSYYVVNDESSENISFSENGTFIFNIVDEDLKVFSTEKRKYILNIELDITDNHIRKVYNNTENSMIYVVDDYSVKGYDFNGELKEEFAHKGSAGYDVVSSIDSDDLYFSDGVGVVKVNNINLNPNKWKYTMSLAADGGWAMGLKIVKTSSGEKVVLFNGSSIIVFDKNLEMIAYAEATEEDNRPREALYLKVDKNRAVAGSLIALRGGGFVPFDSLLIEFADETWEIEADEDGRFNEIIGVPNVLPIRTDIKVTGELSNSNYSISFSIE